MNRRKFLSIGFYSFLASLGLESTVLSQDSNREEDDMLVNVDIPSPAELRGGWAAMAAVYAAHGWKNYIYATENQWFYHDGGGNWACLRFKDKDQAILIGHDHEYSNTYFGEAAAYFQEEETNLLAGAPEWWSFDLNPKPFGDWIGFIYGWDGEKWQRAAYDKQDGFEATGLLRACSVEGVNALSDFIENEHDKPDAELLKALIAADANITEKMLERVFPEDVAAGAIAAQRFLKADLG